MIRSSQLNRLRFFYLLLTVVLCGGVVMALEVLGTRVIGTYYGTSLYIWGALITVTLVSLSIGYYLLGMLADKYPNARSLYLLVGLAGCATLLVLAGKSILAPVYAALGAQWGAVVSAFVIFSLPITLLGGVGPFAIRLIGSETKKLGRMAGSIYALSTIGSVVGTLVVSFILIPAIGTTESVIGVAVLLLVLSGVGFLIERRPAGMAALVIAVAVSLLPRGDATPGGGDVVLLWRGESLYSRFIVFDHKTIGDRMLLVNGIQQTGKPLDPALLATDVQLLNNSYYLELLPYYKYGRRALLIGLAGGMLPQVLANHDIETTAVDIDPVAIEVARKYFDYKGTAVAQDGRRFVEDSREKFDYCIIDAYASDVIPFHLITREMFLSVRAVLVDDGILAMNYIGYPKGEAAASVYRTVADVFGANVRVFKTQESDAIQNVFLFASPKPLQLTPLWQSEEDAAGGDRLLNELARREVDWKSLSGILLTDNYNPIDLMRVDESLHWRRKSIEAFGDIILW